MLRSNRSATEAFPSRGERGSGLLGSIFAIAIVAAVLGVVANVALGLWVRSTVDSVAYDAARTVASASPVDGPPTSDQAVEQLALRQARDLLGDYSKRVTLEFVDNGDPNVVALHVETPGVALMPRMFANHVVVGGMNRTITVPREHAP